MLADGKFSPLTGTIGFIMAPASHVAQMFHRWQAPLYRKTNISLEITPVPFLSFDDIMTLLQPMTSRASKWLFVPVGQNITALFSNCWTGLDPSPISALSVKHCKTKGIRMTMVKHGHRGKKYDSRIIEVFSADGEKPFRIERSVFCSNDGGKWKFGSTGKLYPFENKSNYERKIIKDRFSDDDVWAFMNYFKINANDENYYISANSEPLYEVSMRGGLLPNMREYGFADLPGVIRGY